MNWRRTSLLGVVLFGLIITQAWAQLQDDPDKGMGMGYVHFDLGMKHWSKGAYDAAIPQFQYCVTHAKNFRGCAKVEDQSHYYLGTIYQAKRNIGQAVQHYQAAIAVNPKYAAPRLRLAQILSKSGNHAQAVEHLEKALETNPKSASVHAALGRVCKDMKKYDLAWNHAREAEKNGGDVKELLASLRRVSKEPAGEPQAVQQESSKR